MFCRGCIKHNKITGANDDLIVLGSYAYDKFGNSVETIDVLCNTIFHTYDSFDNILSEWGTIYLVRYAYNARNAADGVVNGRYDWQSAKRRRQALKESQSMLNEAGDRIKGTDDRINSIDDRINGVNDRINGTGDRINDRIKSLIAENPGISAMRIVEMSDKSESTIRRTLALLKKQGILEYRGSKKTGGYYAIEEGISEHSAADCGIMALFNENTAL